MRRDSAPAAFAGDAALLARFLSIALIMEAR
jgi:hypothetical protein